MKRLLNWVIGIIRIALSPFLAAAGFARFVLQLEFLFWGIIGIIVLCFTGILAWTGLARIFRSLGITPASTDTFLNRLRAMVRLMRRRHASLARMRVVVLGYAVRLTVVGARPKARLRSRRGRQEALRPSRG